YCDFARRALASFPTRRSSDLVAEAPGEVVAFVVFHGATGDVERHAVILDEGVGAGGAHHGLVGFVDAAAEHGVARWILDEKRELDRKSTRLNSSHVKISYAVF